MAGARAVIVGASGRMGRALVRTAGEFPAVRITGVVASPGSDSLGRDAGLLAGVEPLGVEVTSDLPAALAAADVAIDFSRPQATRANIAACRAAGTPLLIGTTGFASEVSEAELDAAACDLPLLIAPNTSLGVAVLMELVRRAARALPAEFDIEIIEAHHRMKRDAPSGTALALGGAAGEGRGLAPAQALAAASAARTAPRRQGEIGFAVVRGGEIVGEHTVLFAGPGEELRLNHRAADRAIFARGALRAALWLAAQSPGRYGMSDIIHAAQVLR
ncbi:MAG TPA: 4-hydroxy-tetrahydrodipicolinate reductase [Steroidobacteraceae bacterium]|nr:4-hydroxy-tetrahydrodipicolinate reductase [Steroidobacteraceae bacterium]